VKKFIFLVILCAVCVRLNFAEENQPENNINIYTLFVNIVNENFHFPLIGFVNIASGSHGSPQVGFVNLNQNNFNGLQTGFVNMVGGNFSGLQMGFVNTILESVKGVQLGFVSAATNSFNGTQISFVNIAKKINGFQLGFVNYAESVENGIPLGFVSVVRNGGYKAVELSTNEVAAINIAFKIGVDKLYTSIIVSHNPMKADVKEQIFTGMGLGSIIAINENLFFNPELAFINTAVESTQQDLSLAPSFGYKIMSGLSVLIGPSITWAYTKKDEEPFFCIIHHKINEQNSILLGGKAALRFQW
jgi:hypothetical protein